MGPMRGGKMYGTTSIGERGQVVIPADAREELGIQPGEKFVVFGSEKQGAIALIKAEKFNHFAQFFLTQSQEFEKMAKAFMAEQDNNEE